MYNMCSMLISLYYQNKASMELVNCCDTNIWYDMLIKKLNLAPKQAYMIDFT